MLGFGERFQLSLGEMTNALQVEERHADDDGSCDPVPSGRRRSRNI